MSRKDSKKVASKKKGRRVKSDQYPALAMVISFGSITVSIFLHAKHQHFK
jgi:hypothetical protein